jgi:hypothetical protein
MRKVYLFTSILLLSSVWLMAQTTPSSSGSATQQPSTGQTSPSSEYPSQAAPDTTQTSTSNSTIEGCLAGSAGNFTLTDTAGKSWQLAGDTSKLTEHVGHQVRITGSEAGGAAGGASGAGAGSSAAGGSSASPSTFTVQKVKMVSSSCPTSK